MITILLKPRLWGTRNRLRQITSSPTRMVRSVILLAVGLGIAYSIYFGGLWSLRKMDEMMTMAYLPPALVLGMVFVSIFVMLVFSASASALGALYHGLDLELVLASPIPRDKFYWGKLIDIVLSNSWIAVIVLVPLTFLFGTYYHAPGAYYIVAFLLYIPFFIIPSAVAIILSTMLAYVIPPSRSRQATLVLFIGVAASLGYLIVWASNVSQKTGANMEFVLHLVKFFSYPNTPWMPSYWLATALGGVIEGDAPQVIANTALLLTASIVLCSLSYLILAVLFNRVYSGSHAESSRRVGAHFIFRVVSRFIPKSCRLVFIVLEKELKSLVRDPVQIMHIMLFSSICSLYLYFLTFEHQMSGKVAPHNLDWWNQFILMNNMVLEAFVIIALSTRFVFPSVSLEGKVFWLLRSAPQTLRQLISARMFTWFIVVFCLTEIVFGTAAYIFYGASGVFLLKIAFLAILSYGTVGIAIGLGSFFADFDWEYEAQLAASFGSMTFMLTGVLYAGIMMTVFWVSTRMLVFGSALGTPPSLIAIEVVCFVTLIALANITLVSRLMAFGERALISREH